MLFSEELTPLSSGACGTTSFLRKEAKKLRRSRHHHPLNLPAESGQNPLNLLNPGRLAVLLPFRCVVKEPAAGGAGGADAVFHALILCFMGSFGKIFSGICAKDFDSFF